MMGWVKHRGYVNCKSVLMKANWNLQSYTYPATVPLKEATHGGDDVAVFASGPWAHIFTGTFEQNYIPHGMAYAACIGKGLTACHSSWYYENCTLNSLIYLFIEQEKKERII